MKNIEIRHLKRKAEIAEEFNTVLLSALLFNKYGVKMAKSHSHYKQELDNYLNGFPKQYLTKENISRLNQIRAKLLPLSKSSAQSLVESVFKHADLITDFSHINLINYNKQGLKGGVKQKSDICVEFINAAGDVTTTKHFSLKQYEQYSDPQVASGTYLSTIAGLAFEPLGRGQFSRPDGKTFVSKNHEDLKRSFMKYYGKETLPIVDKLIAITKETHKLRTIKVRPANLDEIRKKTGNAAAPLFVDLLKIIYQTDPIAFKNRFIERSGIKAHHEKEMIYSAMKSGTPVTFNSLLDKEFGSFLKKVNHNNIAPEIVRSGLNKEGQGVSIEFKKSDKMVLLVNIPLTININGAWANEDRWCAISKMHIKKDHIRPGKAKQLDTSTNCYVKLKAPVFNQILKERRNNDSKK